MNALADRVFAGTKEIGGLVGAVQAESEKAVAAIARSADSVKIGVDRAAEAGLSLEEITAAARESCGRMNEIVHATTESIESATKHTSENEVLAAKMGETTRELLAQAELLRADVRRFQI